MNSISRRYFRLQRQKDDLRLKWLSKMKESEEYKSIHGDIIALQEECEKSSEGHDRGQFHDNGLGWSWWYCAKCGKRFDERQYDVNDN